MFIDWVSIFWIKRATLRVCPYLFMVDRHKIYLVLDKDRYQTKNLQTITKKLKGPDLSACLMRCSSRGQRFLSTIYCIKFEIWGWIKRRLKFLALIVAYWKFFPCFLFEIGIVNNWVFHNCVCPAVKTV